VPPMLPAPISAIFLRAKWASFATCATGGRLQTRPRLGPLTGLSNL
jgi:hypothetical protein